MASSAPCYVAELGSPNWSLPGHGLFGIGPHKQWDGVRMQPLRVWLVGGHSYVSPMLKQVELCVCADLPLAPPNSSPTAQLGQKAAKVGDCCYRPLWEAEKTDLKKAMENQ